MKFPNVIDSNTPRSKEDVKVFVVDKTPPKTKKPPKNNDPEWNEWKEWKEWKKDQDKQDKNTEIPDIKIKLKEKKVLQDLLNAWHFELTRTYNHTPSPCYPINPVTRRLISPCEFYDILLKVYLINEEKIYHMDIPPIVNIFAYDSARVFETYEDFLERKPSCREKLRDYFFTKQLKYENNEWENIPHIPLSFDFLNHCKKMAEHKYQMPIVEAKDILENEKVIKIPKLIQKTSKDQLFRLLNRCPDELKYFTPMEAQFFGFTKDEGKELVDVYKSGDKNKIKEFRDKFMAKEENNKMIKQIGGQQTSKKFPRYLHLLPFL